MAKTIFATNNALTKKVWEEQLFRDVLKISYFNRFSGPSSNNIIQTNTMLEKEQGDNISFGLRMRLQGAGVTSGQTLEGNEESLTTYAMNVSLQQYRHGVRDNGALDRQRAMFSIDDESRQALMDWAGEKIDLLAFNALDPTLTAPTTVMYQMSNTVHKITSWATASAAITTSDNGLLTPALLMAAKSFALTGGNRTQVPLRPIKIDGKDHYVLLVHPDVAYDIKNNSTYNSAVTYAQERGDDNPIFTGALAVYDGIVIHEHENVPIYNTFGTGAQAGSVGYFMGAQALVQAWGQRGEVIAKNFDYENEHGYAFNMITAVAKANYNSSDFGVITLALGRSKVSDLTS